MRVQPDWPIRPFTAMTMRARGLAVVTCSAASMPAPPAPRIRTSADISSRGSNVGPRRYEVWISCECGHPPIRDGDADEHDGNGDRHAEACSPVVVEADVADAV